MSISPNPSLKARIEISMIVGSAGAIPGAILGIFLAAGQTTIEAQNSAGLGMTLLFWEGKSALP